MRALLTYKRSKARQLCSEIARISELNRRASLLKFFRCYGVTSYTTPQPKKPAQSPGMPPLGRYFLHAHRIRFRLPSNDQPKDIVSPLPEELEKWMAALEAPL